MSLSTNLRKGLKSYFSEWTHLLIVDVFYGHKIEQNWSTFAITIYSLNIFNVPSLLPNYITRICYIYIISPSCVWDAGKKVFVDEKLKEK